MKLGKLRDKLARHNYDHKVEIAFGYYFPTNISSYRGDYSHAAINYTDSTKVNELLRRRQKSVSEGRWGGDEPPKLEKPQTVEWWVERINKTINEYEVHYGYKGGEYTFDEDTPVYLAEGYGMWSQVSIGKIVAAGGTVYLQPVVGDDA